MIEKNIAKERLTLIQNELINNQIEINKSLEKITEITAFVDEFFQNTNVKFPREWKQFEKLFKKNNISRKECILLPFKTLAKALKS